MVGLEMCGDPTDNTHFTTKNLKTLVAQYTFTDRCINREAWLAVW